MLVIWGGGNGCIAFILLGRASQVDGGYKQNVPDKRHLLNFLYAEIYFSIFRLESYDRNNNFSQQPDTTSEVFHMDLPDCVSYRDVTANTPLPPTSNETATLYLRQFSSSLDKTCKQLYNDRYINK